MKTVQIPSQTIPVLAETAGMITKVPFRALIPKGSRRITVAFAGIRAQCTCMAMGQAMGATAALEVQRGVASREVSSQDIMVLTVEHWAVPIYT